MRYPSVRLKRGEERRLERGHLWIYSNEIGHADREVPAGEIVQVLDSAGKHLGYGFFNRSSLIAVRLLTRNVELDLFDLLRRRLHAAEDRRRAWGFKSVYRMIHGEADFIPGLVADRFSSIFVLESFCAGADKILPYIVEILSADFNAGTIIEKSASRWREYEGLEPREKILAGANSEIIVEIDGISYNINALSAQKTGFYLDQRDTRCEVERLAAGRRVLDCFCCDGGFSLHAFRGGAAEVVGVDISESAIRRAAANAELNGMKGKLEFLRRNLFEGPGTLAAGLWDMIILDPPALVKGKKNLAAGLKGYRKINETALRILQPGGILVTCSCSQQVDEKYFLDVLCDAAARSKKHLSIFRISGASKDHPILPSMPETRYLKCVFAAVEEL